MPLEVSSSGWLKATVLYWRALHSMGICPAESTPPITLIDAAE